MAKNIKQIGKVLIDDGLIDKSDLEEALVLQEKCSSLLGDVLMSEGKITAYNFYKALAKHLDIEFVNLLDSPPDELFIEADERQNYLNLKVIPWKKDNKTIVLATSQPSEELEEWAQDKYKDYRIVITSQFDIYWMVDRFFAEDNTADAVDGLWQIDPINSAKTLFAKSALFSVVVLCFIAITMIIFFDELLVPLFISINIFYLITLLFKVIFFISGMKIERDKRNYITNIADVDDASLPIYTILAPMYKEKKRTIEGLANAIRKMDYPSSKLDVKLIVEEDDLSTIKIAQKLGLESYFHIVKVPVSHPRTKPKACNYALKFATGEYITIYDAEDRPDATQLKKVIKKFRNSGDDMACVQCRLNYYNREENILTKLFSIEYSSWFDFMTPGLEYLKIPVPLGGTSNHFKTEMLRDLMAWDPYNVTEDADLGIRLSQRGKYTTIINSLTLEEAPLTFISWMKQRSRWLKGYMQTYLVHMRNPSKLYKTLGTKGFFGFMFFVGAPALVFFTIPFIAAISLLSLYYSEIFPQWFSAIAWLNFICGVVVHLAIALIVIARNNWWDIKFTSIIFPFYWILHIIASFKGLYELIFNPHYWDKTEHGISKIADIGNVK